MTAQTPDHVSDEFVEITRADDPLFDSFWLPLYRRTFPDDERVPEEDQRSATVAADEHILVGLADGRPVSMARYDVMRRGARPAFAYLPYMAVDEGAVSRGHGQQMFAEVVRRAIEDPANPGLLIFEVQRPDVATATEAHQSAERRLAFYRRQGAYGMKGVEYVQHVPGQPGVPMLIMVRPLTDRLSLDDAYKAAVTLFGGDITRVGKSLSASPPISDVGLTHFEWASLVERGFFTSIVTGFVGAALGYILFQTGQLQVPPAVLMSIWVSLICAFLAYGRSWKSIREEHETAAQWDRIKQTSFDKAIDRVFEIPYLFTLTVLSFTTIVPQAFMLTLALFYVADNYYNAELARGAAGLLSDNRKPRVGTFMYAREIVGALGRSFMFRTGIPSGSRPAMVEFFRNRSKLNLFLEVVLAMTLAVTTFLTASGDRGTASLVAAAGLVLVIFCEWFIDPHRNLRVGVWPSEGKNGSA